MRDAQRGSAEALEELFRRHWRRAHRAAYLVVGDAAAAEDIAQESFLAAIRALDRFDRRRPFGPWLHRITVNRAIDFARARALRGRERASAGGAGAAPPPDPDAISDELLAALPTSGPSTARWSCCATCSSTRRARSREILELPAGDRQLAPAARRSTGCGRRSRRRAIVSRDRDLGRRLRELRAPDEAEAEERSWEIVRAAYAEREPVRARRRRAPARARGRRRRGRARDRAQPGRGEGGRPGLRRASGSASPTRSRRCARCRRRASCWCRRRAGRLDRPRGRLEAAARRLRATATWSPHGVYVAAAAGRELVAARARRATCAGPTPRPARSATRAGPAPRSIPGSPTEAATTSA